MGRFPKPNKTDRLHSDSLHESRQWGPGFRVGMGNMGFQHPKLQSLVPFCNHIMPYPGPDSSHSRQRSCWEDLLLTEWWANGETTVGRQGANPCVWAAQLRSEHWQRNPTACKSKCKTTAMPRGNNLLQRKKLMITLCILNSQTTSTKSWAGIRATEKKNICYKLTLSS